MYMHDVEENQNREDFVCLIFWELSKCIEKKKFLMNLCCLQVRSPPNTGTLIASLPPLRGSPQNGRGWSPSTRRPLRQHPHAGLSRPRLWSRGQVVRTRRTSQRASPWRYRLPALSPPWTKNRRRTFPRWRKSSLFPVVRSKWMGTGSLWNHWRPRE